MPLVRQEITPPLAKLVARRTLVSCRSRSYIETPPSRRAFERREARRGARTRAYLRELEP